MGFRDFLASVEDPRLRAVAQHWDQARGARLMPAWGEIDPTAMAHCLPIVWAWKYDRASDRFTGRLAGEDIQAAFGGKSLRGAKMEEFFKDFDYPNIFARHRRVVTEPCFAHGKGRVFAHAHRVGVGERIIMPLSEDGQHGDGLLGATVYDPGPDQWQSGTEPNPGELVTFYSLR